MLRQPPVFTLFLACVTSCFALTSRAQTSLPDWLAICEKSWLGIDVATLNAGPPESAAIERLGFPLRGSYEPAVLSSQLAEIDLNQIQIGPKPGKTVTYGGVEYIEFTNATSFVTSRKANLVWSGRIGEDVNRIIFVRMVRPYRNSIKVNGAQSPVDYMSDVGMFILQKNGKYKFSKIILYSDLAKNFRFEDGRVSVLYSDQNSARYFLSGTDYSPHLEGSHDPDVMNGVVELSLDEEGIPQVLKVDEKTGKPNFWYISPPPLKNTNGGFSFTDAKNGTMFYNARNELVVRTRFRKDGAYAEQVFIFKDFETARSYDWKYAFDDLDQQHISSSESRVQPLFAKTVLKSGNLIEQFHDARIMPEKGKGMGPGARPFLVKRVGQKLFISDGVGAELLYAGTIPNSALPTFVLKDGETNFITPDHEIRYFKANDQFVKRHYTGDFKLFDDRFSKIRFIYADAVQPTLPEEIGVKTGILDLQHAAYFMGTQIVIKNGRAWVRATGGANDANTFLIEIDALKLLLEMSDASPRRLLGQVYTPAG